MSTKFNTRPLLDLEKLFLNDSSEISRLQQEFEINGWCFVRLPQASHSLLTQLNQSLSKFFALDQDEKSRYLSSDAFGYTRVGHKEGIKILTDQHGTTNAHITLPMNIKATIQDVTQLINNLTYRLKPIINKLVISDDKPLKQVKISDLSMLDIVNYFNNKTGPIKVPEVGHNTDEVNCVPHYDPGLFSLSILSTCDGLQLKDRYENKWIDGPNNSQHDQSNIGVIWLGEAASILTENRLKSGIHRVVYPRIIHQARLTIWQEVCTTAQIQRLVEKDSNTQYLPANAQVTLVNQPDSVPMNILAGGETVNDFMKRIEFDRGLSESKSMPMDMHFNSNPVVDTNNNNYSSSITNKLQSLFPFFKK
ncbi:unnamed protein product [Adineta steineri]|uniref:Isopenicillin N synthase-like Fe(2+) 2OG dioxygenase domain-containing protein n=1 Tax=Adineta steineri TaxID=433720 RepID=A0A814EXB7_9BILA|nr:unnamed protein product [Adineta steineri]CAF3698380.1 unnamed protein product [Adineta steineri]